MLSHLKCQTFLKGYSVAVFVFLIKHIFFGKITHINQFFCLDLLCQNLNLLTIRVCNAISFLKIDNYLIFVCQFSKVLINQENN